MPHYPALSGQEHADVCVIGAGIAGLTSAYMLLREGKTVVLIDADPGMANRIAEILATILQSALDG